MNLAVDGARRLLTLLAGGEGPPAPSLDLPSLWARLDEDPGDMQARHTLLQLVQARTLPTRLAMAVAEDTVDVQLRDGSELSRPQAERALAQKEADRVYPPLRAPLLRSRRRVLDPSAVRVAFDDVAAACGVGAPASLTEDLAFLRAFLVASSPLAVASKEILTSSAGPVTDAGTLARALDRPAGEHSSDQAAIDVVRVTREALPPDTRPLQRRAAPRALAGHVVDDGEIVRVLWGETLRLGRQRALLEGVGRALSRLGGVPAVAAGLGLALQSAPVRRAVGASSSVASALWREAVAASLLEARIAAAVVVAHASAEVDPSAPLVDQRAMRRDAVHRAVRAAVGEDVADLAEDRLMPPWPDGIVDLDAASASADKARRQAGGAQDLLTLRDIGDEGLLLRPRSLLMVGEALQGLEPPSAEAMAAAWTSLIGEIA